MTKKKSRNLNPKMKKALLIVAFIAFLAFLVFLNQKGYIDLESFFFEEEDYGVQTEYPEVLATSTKRATKTPAPDENASYSDDIIIMFTDPLNDNPDLDNRPDLKLVELINSAKTSVYVAAFELNLDNVIEALISAKNRGLDVKLVYDSEHTDEPVIKRLKNEDILAVPDQRSALMHNKFLIIDQKTVWTGSWNLTTNGTFRNNNNVVIMESEGAVENYTTEFNEMLADSFGPKSPQNTASSFFVEEITVENYFAPEDPVVEAILDELSSAAESIYFMTFSFTQDEIGQGMLEKMLEGAEVKGVFERTGANTQYSECNLLRENGATVYLDGNPGVMHHKVIIIDESVVITGSFNFSANATESNDENLLIIHNPAIARLYIEEFLRIVDYAYLAVDSCKVSD